jgi:hypothetical protein
MNRRRDNKVTKETEGQTIQLQNEHKKKTLLQKRVVRTKLDIHVYFLFFLL